MEQLFYEFHSERKVLRGVCVISAPPHFFNLKFTKSGYFKYNQNCPNDRVYTLADNCSHYSHWLKARIKKLSGKSSCMDCPLVLLLCIWKPRNSYMGIILPYTEFLFKYFLFIYWAAIIAFGIVKRHEPNKIADMIVYWSAACLMAWSVLGLINTLG